ncbi:hypothetical protein A3BBH6_26540 [Alistipes onderdonkii subsp. vulgaris]|uniref:hypothetical protein n=1 Tax=Alistipes onderdonkii TaxID=328813 RepID=UPI001141A989|nr:hypothetical protein [Alistipes onderdonkii]BBL02418.1 hypothetical protein A3BBH6_26540 [Alistipes onderdonkii subsp. vulgaris]
MKKLAVILVFLPLLFSCSPSREEKAAEIARSEMIKILYNVDSYEPIETQIDSAFTSVYTDFEVVRTAHDLIELNADEKKEGLQWQYKHAKSSAAIWSDSWDAYSREQYRQAKEEMDDYANQLKELDDEVKTKMNEIRDYAKAVIEHQFCGWNIYHRFRCANGLGVQQISDILIIADENMEIVKGRFILDEDDDYSLDKLKKTIDKAIGKEWK